jgi:hypothetical protein
MYDRTEKNLFSLLAMVAILSTGSCLAGVTLESEMTFEKVAQVGETYQGTIVLRNTDAAPAEAKLYQTDYSFNADGSNQFGERGRSPRSNANWITLSRDLVTVGPNSVERVDFVVKVPAGKSDGLAGTYWSMVMVEPLGVSSLEGAGALSDGTTQVSQILRYGVQIISHIGKTGETGLTFTNPHIVKDEERRFFAIDVENSGQRALRPSLSLELYSETGSPVGKFQGSAQRLYPGTSARFPIDLGDVPKGKYLGLVVADGTGDNLFGANVELEIE